MVAPKAEIGLSPLEQIRQCEAEVTRRVLAAREAAGNTIAQAALDVTHMKKQAQEAGNREGQAHYREIVSKAAEEAELLVAQAKYQAEELRRKGNRQMTAAVRQAVNLVTGLEVEG